MAKLFPQAVVKRMDADAMQRRDAYRETLGAFRTGKIDILVGTQMIAKGLHFPNVTLVGIVNADLEPALAGFSRGRADVSIAHAGGRARRARRRGGRGVRAEFHAVFSPSIQYARHHDFEGFWEQEIEFRQQWNYPPFTHMVLIGVRSPHQERAQFSTETLARRLKEALPPGTVLSDPAPAPLEKSHGGVSVSAHAAKQRRSLKLSRHLKAVLEKLTFPEDVVVTVDVDAYQLM